MTTLNDAINAYVGKHVLIRSADSGVHFGTLTAASFGAQLGTVVLADSRRLWEWKTANNGISLTDIAIAGIDHAGSRVSPTVPEIIIAGVCEIIPAHGLAVATIAGAADAKA